MKKHKLPKLLVRHLDAALRFFDNDIMSVLKAHERQGDWTLFTELNKLDLLTLVDYYIKGYEVDLTLEEKVDSLVNWAKNLPECLQSEKDFKSRILLVLRENYLLEDEEYDSCSI